MTHPCPNCEATMNVGDPCPECEHHDGDAGCECEYCCNDRDEWDREQQKINDGKH